MKRLFADRITDAGREAIQDLIDHVAQELDQAARDHGEDSMEAAQQRLVLGSMHYLIGAFEKADPLIRSYVIASEQRYGPDSDELLSGLILLSNNCIGWRRREESRSVLERVKFVAERCSSLRDPLLEGLYDLAVRRRGANDPVSETRGFILLLMTLSWCVRHQRDTHIYERFAPSLKSFFGSHGFVEERWDWLIRHCNHNLHDVVGLISIFQEKDILPLTTQPLLTAGMREESLRSLAAECPVRKESELRERILNSGGHPVALRFVCPMCGSQELRTKFLEPYYPVSTLDRIEADPGGLDLCHLYEREPSEYEGAGHTDGWEFWCDKCHLVPKLDQYDEDESQEESLARWLLDNCPQDEGLPATEDSPSEG